MRQQDPNTLQTKGAGSLGVLGQRWLLCSFDPSWYQRIIRSLTRVFACQSLRNCFSRSQLAKTGASGCPVKLHLRFRSSRGDQDSNFAFAMAKWVYDFGDGKAWRVTKGHKPYDRDGVHIVDPAEPVKLEILVFARARNALRVFCDSFPGRWPSWDEESSRRKGCKSRWNGLHRIARAARIHSDYRGLHSLLPEWLPVSQGAWTAGVCHTITSTSSH